jgi:uncharacterized membrane protein YkoI
MTTFKKWIGIAALVMLAGGMTTFVWSNEEKGEDEAKEHADAKAVLAVAKIDLLTAVKTAIQKVPDGKAFRAATEKEKDKSIFEVHLLVGDKVKEVEIDAVTGNVLEVEDDDDEPADAAKDAKMALEKSKVTLAAAIEAALAGHKDAKAFEAEIEWEDDKAEVEVEYLDGGKIMEANIDPMTGKVTKVEEEKE